MDGNYFLLRKRPKSLGEKDLPGMSRPKDTLLKKSARVSVDHRSQLSHLEILDKTHVGVDRDHFQSIQEGLASAKKIY